MTDGAVFNTNQVINLIQKSIGENSNSNARLHTFGIGSGADTHLVKGAASAGLGSSYFIYNFPDIEAKVIDAL